MTIFGSRKSDIAISESRKSDMATFGYRNSDTAISGFRKSDMAISGFMGMQAYSGSGGCVPGQVSLTAAVSQVSCFSVPAVD